MKNLTTILEKEELRLHWQGHRALTRKVIEKFEETDLFEFSIGGMRPFSEMVMELLAIAAPGLESIVHKTDLVFQMKSYSSKEALLAAWDESTALIDSYYAQLSADRFEETFNLFGQYHFKNIDNILYFIDNEIHHRGQGYTYLRALCIEPPAFWERD